MWDNPQFGGLECLGITASLITEVMIVREMGFGGYWEWGEWWLWSLRLDMTVEMGHPRADV